MLGPHHDVGISSDLKARAMEYAHHGDALVPRQQRFGNTRGRSWRDSACRSKPLRTRPGVVPGTFTHCAVDRLS